MAVKACASITLYRVDDGTPGTPGADGKSQYLHIKYSDDGETFTANNGEDLGAWIGTLVDFNPADSNVFSAYTWKKFTEDVDQELENIRQTIAEQNTELLETAESITLTALTNYVETSRFNEFAETTESELKIQSDRIDMNFNVSNEQVAEANGSIQRISEALEKHFEFSENGLIIKAGENSMELILDNDLIKFVKNGEQFGWWDGVNFYTGNIVVNVEERAQFGNFAFVPRSNGSLDFLKVGG